MTAVPGETPQALPAGTESDPWPLGRTGDARVDATLQRLDETARSGSLDEQAEAGEAVHRALQERLAELGGG